MKLVFRICLFVLILFFSFTAIGEQLQANYSITTKGFKIGKLNWKITTDKNNFENKIILKSGGVFSPLYKFSGEYFSSGSIKNNKFFSEKYYHKWLTKKKQKEMQILFNKNKILTINQRPAEKEDARIDFFALIKFSDPLTSFLNIINGQKISKTIDGRRIYTMFAQKSLHKSNKVTVLIESYTNIWADHKRNDLEKIVFYIKPGNALPELIEIYFKGSLFKVYKN